MPQGTPRKFSEKIAILERKQNEEQEMFYSVMRDVRAITNNKTLNVAESPISTYPCSLISKNKEITDFSDSQCSTLNLQHSSTSLNTNTNPLSFTSNRLGESLPNVYQIVEQQPYNNNYLITPSVQNYQVRTRSPGAYYHPYMNKNYPVSQKMNVNERVSSLEKHNVKPTDHLRPPDPNWLW